MCVDTETSLPSFYIHTRLVSFQASTRPHSKPKYMQNFSAAVCALARDTARTTLNAHP